MKYKEYLKSEDWVQKRRLKRRKRLRCAICAATDELDIHHLNYRNLYDVQQSDLRRLCRRCHFLTHKLYKEGKIIFRNDNHHSRFAIIKCAVKKELGITNVNMFTDMRTDRDIAAKGANI